MIAEVLSMKLDRTLRSALDLYSSKRRIKTTPAAIRAIIKDLPEYKLNFGQTAPSTDNIPTGGGAVNS